MLLGSSTTPYFGALNPSKPLPKSKELATHVSNVETKLNDKISLLKNKSSFIQNTTLAEALKWSPEETFQHLSKLVSPEDFKAIQNLEHVPSPLKRANVQNSEWLKSVKMIGINPRAVGTYFNILKTAMIYPERGIHILPIYTTDNTLISPVQSLFAPVDWKKSEEFLDPYLSQKGLKTPTQQLAFTVNALHAMGRVVGVDVLAHMAGYSYESFLHPDKFEWVQLDKKRISQLYPKDTSYDSLTPWLKEKIHTAFIRSQSSSKTYTELFNNYKKQFSNSKNEQFELYELFEHHICHAFKIALESKESKKRFQEMFSKEASALSPREMEVLQRVHETLNLQHVNEKSAKQYFATHLAIMEDRPASAIKKAVISFLKQEGDGQGRILQHPDYFFSIPASEREQLLWGNNLETKKARHQALIHHIQNQGLLAAPLPEGEILRPSIFDQLNPERRYRAFFDKPNKNDPTEVNYFLSLNPYAFFPVKANGYLNIRQPNWPVFTYFSKKVSTLAKELNLDFIRADLAHSQVSQATDDPVEKPHEFWAHLKHTIQNHIPYFGVFGESLLMGGRSVDIVEDLNHKKVDIIVGNTDYIPVDANFIDTIQTKSKEKGRQFKEAFPVVSHDSDLKKYRDQNKNPLAIVTRYFMHLFQTNPGYAMAGFETNPKSLAQDYLFKQDKKFDWGNDLKRFQSIQDLRQQYEKLKLNFLDKPKQEWLASGTEGVGAWTLEFANPHKATKLFVSNTDLQAEKKSVELNMPFIRTPTSPTAAKCVFSTAQPNSKIPSIKIDKNTQSVYIDSLAAGENRIYKLVSPSGNKD